MKLLLLLLASFSVQADFKEDIFGKWNLYAESTAMEKERVKLNGSWEFKDNGILKTISSDRYGRTKNVRINLSYEFVEGGIKKQLSPGRSRTEVCKVVEMTDDDLVLKCKYMHLFFNR